MERVRKKHSFAFIHRLGDVLATVTAWALAYFLRFSVLQGGQTGLHRDFIEVCFLLIILVLLYSTHNRLYEAQRHFPWHQEFLLVLKSQMQAVISFVIILYFFWPTRLSRSTIFLYLGLILIIATSIRRVTRSLLFYIRKKKENAYKVLIVGQSEGLHRYIKEFSGQKKEGAYRFIGWVDSDGRAQDGQMEALSLEQVALEGPEAPDAVIIGYNERSSRQLKEMIALFNKTFIKVFIIPEIQNSFIGYNMEEFYGVPMISVNTLQMSMLQSGLKRFIDILGASMGLLVLTPLFFLIGIWVKLSSPGPIFYGQERMTLNGRLFTMWKFRSMKANAESDGAQWAEKNDARRTRIGSFLRKTSLDELPQLWNVLRGSMSLVGPRPERPLFIEKFKDQIPAYMLRHRMKAGITGWAQVNGWRGNTSLTKRVACDLYYIRKWSLFLDIKILFLTFIKGFINENAY